MRNDQLRIGRSSWRQAHGARRLERSRRRFQVRREAVVEIADFHQALAERAVKRGLVGVRELFFELHKVTHKERSNETDIALTQLQLHHPSSLPNDSTRGQNRQVMWSE
jgi:hypothetical protein